MLIAAIIFLVIAIITGYLGFTSVANVAVEIAQALFYLFIFLFVVFMAIWLLGSGPPPPLA